MNCQEAIERLPWWLNGSLEPAERREVEEHLAACAACREALGETRLAWEIFAQHVPSEALVAYAYDERVEGIGPDLIERHLASCPQCAAELEMTRASRLLGEHDDVAVLAPRAARQAVPERRLRRERNWQAAALAAGLTSLVAIGGWMQSSQQHRGGQEMASASHPAAQVNTAVAQLLQGETRSIERHSVKLPKEGMATIVLSLRSDTHQKHVYDLRDARDQRIILHDVDLPGGGGDLNRVYFVTFDHALLRPGDYVIQVYGTDNGAHVPSAPIPFSIE